MCVLFVQVESKEYWKKRFVAIGLNVYPPGSKKAGKPIYPARRKEDLERKFDELYDDDLIDVQGGVKKVAAARGLDAGNFYRLKQVRAKSTIEQIE